MAQYPWPERRYGRIFLRMPDGSEQEVDAFTASRQLKAWADVVGGLYCYQATSLIEDAEEAITLPSSTL